MAARDAAALVAVLVGGGLLSIGVVDRSVVPMDEGQLATIADRLLSGERLYRDVHTGLFPGIYWLTAALFDGFGRDLLVTRWAQLTVNLCTALLLWALGRRVMPAGWALLAPALYFVLVPFAFPVFTILNYSPVALAFGLGALLCSQRYLQSGRSLDAALVGILLAACVLTKQNFGALAALAIAIGLAWGRPSSALAARSVISGFAPVLAAGALGVGLAFAYAVSTGTAADWLQQAVLGLGGAQLEGYRNPMPPILGAHPEADGRFTFLYSPAALFGYLLRGEDLLGFSATALIGPSIRLSYGAALAVLAVGPALLLLGRKRGDARERRETRGLVVFSSLLFLGIFPSAIWSHLAFVSAPLLLQLGIAASFIDRSLARRWPGSVRALRGVAVAAVLIAWVTALHVAGDIRRWHPFSLDLPGASLRTTQEQADLLRGATAFLERCARPGEHVFVAPDMPVVYFIAGRSNPTPYDLVIPGSVDGPAIARRLEKTRTRCLVYNPAMYPEFPEFGVLFPELSRYLGEAYRPVRWIRGGETRWLAAVRKNP